MRVLFRADASAHMGAGHVMRCLALAEALRTQGAEVHFLCRPQAGDMIGFLEGSGWPVHALSVSADAAAASTGPGSIKAFEAGEPSHSARLGAAWIEDADAVLAFAEAKIRQGEPPDWIVVDHYALDARWEERIRTRIPGVFAVDDLADRPHACDALLDAAEDERDGQRYASLIPGKCARLFGPRHALLRPEFPALRRTVRPRTGAIRRILVSFGGSDPDDFTGIALEALADGAVPVDVAVGAAYARKGEAELLCASRSGWTFHCQTGWMAGLMASADFYVGAGGNTAWERCCLGLPGLALCIARNQATLIGVLAGRGAAHPLGGDAAVGAIRQAIRHFTGHPEETARMSARAFGLCDGLGAARAAAFIFGKGN